MPYIVAEALRAKIFKPLEGADEESSGSLLKNVQAVSVQHPTSVTASFVSESPGVSPNPQHQAHELS